MKNLAQALKHFINLVLLPMVLVWDNFMLGFLYMMLFPLSEIAVLIFSKQSNGQQLKTAVSSVIHEKSSLPASKKPTIVGKEEQRPSKVSLASSVRTTEAADESNQNANSCKEMAAASSTGATFVAATVGYEPRNNDIATLKANKDVSYCGDVDNDTQHNNTIPQKADTIDNKATADRTQKLREEQEEAESSHAEEAVNNCYPDILGIDGPLPASIKPPDVSVPLTESQSKKPNSRFGSSDNLIVSNASSIGANKVFASIFHSFNDMYRPSDQRHYYDSYAEVDMRHQPRQISGLPTNYGRDSYPETAAGHQTKKTSFRAVQRADSYDPYENYHEEYCRNPNPVNREHYGSYPNCQDEYVEGYTYQDEGPIAEKSRQNFHGPSTKTPQSLPQPQSHYDYQPPPARTARSYERGQQGEQQSYYYDPRNREELPLRASNHEYDSRPIYVRQPRQSASRQKQQSTVPPPPPPPRPPRSSSVLPTPNRTYNIMGPIASVNPHISDKYLSTSMTENSANRKPRHKELSGVDYEDFRLSSEKCEHTNLSPALCYSLTAEMKSMSGRAGEMFARRAQRMKNFTTDNSKFKNREPNFPGWKSSSYNQPMQSSYRETNPHDYDEQYSCSDNSDNYDDIMTSHQPQGGRKLNVIHRGDNRQQPFGSSYADYEQNYYNNDPQQQYQQAHHQNYYQQPASQQNYFHQPQSTIQVPSKAPINQYSGYASHTSSTASVNSARTRGSTPKPSWQSGKSVDPEFFTHLSQSVPKTPVYVSPAVIQETLQQSQLVENK